MAARFGAYLPQRDFATVREFARAAERLGYHSVSMNDHFEPQLGPPRTPQPECFTTLAAIAASTGRIRIASAMAAASFRSPALLAKTTATLDELSGGRFILGIGAGWMRAEYEAHGYAFPSARERVARLEDTLRIVTAMWTQESPTVEGAYLSVRGAHTYPRPVQQPRIPLMLGGSGPRMLRLMARYADIANLIPPTSGGKDFLKDAAAARAFTLDTLAARIAELREAAERAGRDPDDIEIGGLAVTRIAEDAADPALLRLARRMGFDDVDAARRSPTMLIGTPDQVVAQLEHRIHAIGVTYTILTPASVDTLELFATEVMPAIAH